MAEGLGLKVDDKGFKQAQEQAAEWRARPGRLRTQDVAHYTNGIEVESQLYVQGYDSMDLDTDVLASAMSSSQEGKLFCARHLFIEGGGQVGDKGWLEMARRKADVLGYPAPVEGMIVHRVRHQAVRWRRASSACPVDPALRERRCPSHGDPSFA